MTIRSRMSKRGGNKKPARRQRPIGPVKMKSNLLTLTPYRFKFQLPSQTLASSNVAGQLVLSTTGSAGVRPISAGSFQLFPSTNGLSGYYDLAFACPHTLADLNYASNFTTMFDAYKFGKVTLNLEYLNNISAANSTGLMPTCYMYWDQDDAVIPPSLISISGKQGVKVRQFGDRSRTSLRMSYVPVTEDVIGVNGGGVASAGVAAKPRWVDSSTPAIQHNACKVFVTDIYLPGATSLQVTQAFRLNWTYHISFRAPLLTC